MAETPTRPPKVFISYAWEDDVKSWVRAFAARLRKDGVETVLDLWETDYGDQLPEFMEKAVRESDFVILICTPKYKKKSDGREGGVGYEGHIITAEIFEKSNHRKFIPVLQKGIWSKSAPSWAAGKLYIDLSADPYDEGNYRDLLRSLHGKKPTPPPIGRIPDFPDEEDNSIATEDVQDAVREQTDRETVEKVAREKAERETAEKVRNEAIRKRRLPYYETSQLKKDVSKNEKQQIEKTISLREPNIGIVITLIGLAFIIIIVALLNSPLVAKRSSPTAVATKTESAAATFTLNVQQVTPTKTIRPSQTPTIDFTATPSLGIGSTMISSKDGMVMVYVPEGKFTMGYDNGYSHEKPAHDVYLDAFWIDQTEVTVGQYAKCVDAGICNLPTFRGFYPHDYVFDEKYANYPIGEITWFDANSYCKWVGRRLPTEAEWEKAARGVDERLYPWGNDIPTCSMANIEGCVDWNPAIRLYRHVTVGSYPNGASPYGTLDMIGNVWEWVADWYDGAYYSQSPDTNPQGPTTGKYRVLRGGSELQTARSVNRLWYIPEETSEDFGFRCARDVNP